MADRRARDECGEAPGYRESDRLAALDRFAILDTPREVLFDELVELAADVCDAPIAVINFVAGDRQWFKAEKGIGKRELPLDVSICKHAILQPDLFVVPDLAKDSRFAENPLVSAADGLRFYAGALLETQDGLPIGTLCVLDTRPRAEGLAKRQERMLLALARQVMSELELRRSVSELSRLAQTRRDDAQRVQLALDAGAIIGTWMWDIPNDRFTIDEQFAQSFGIDPSRIADGLALEEVVETVHPDDKPGLAAAIEEALGRGGAYAHQYRVRRADGNYYWIEANGRVDVDESGAPVSFPGVLIDVEERRAIVAERDRALRLLQTFTEAVPGVVYAKDLEGRMLVCNRGTAELIGKPPEAFLGRTDLEFLEDKEQARQVMENDRRIMESGIAEQIEEEVRYPDGRAAVWLSSKAPFRDESGAVVGLIGSSVDITERREAAERERLLAREVDHRAKNLLGVVQSIVQLTKAADIHGFKEAVIGRIHALSRAHSLLAAARWEGIELGQLVREELAPFLSGGTRRVRIDGRPLRLKPAASQSLAMAIHELATNAVKYGSLSTESGSLEIGWGPNSEGTILWWRESGGPRIEAAPSANGFGSTVLRSSIERQLGGSLTLDWAEEGLRCTIAIPDQQLLKAAQGDHRDRPESIQQPGQPAPGRLDGKTVLLVEDEALIALQIQEAIEGLGGSVIGPLSTIESALDALEELRPDAAVLDGNVGGVRSAAVAEKLIGLSIPFAYCTGYSDLGDLPGSPGFPEPLAKPLEPDLLRRTLLALVEWEPAETQAA